MRSLHPGPHGCPAVPPALNSQPTSWSHSSMRGGVLPTNSSPDKVGSLCLAYCDASSSLGDEAKDCLVLNEKLQANTLSPQTHQASSLHATASKLQYPPFLISYPYWISFSSDVRFKGSCAIPYISISTLCGT